MARKRDLKPSFFKNEMLVECGFQTRLLFQGLWLLADREGRLEYRPRFIKAEIFPYEEADIEAMLSELALYRFIDLYEVEGLKVIQVVNFTKHQNVHPKEVRSELPAKRGEQRQNAAENCQLPFPSFPSCTSLPSIPSGGAAASPPRKAVEPEDVSIPADMDTPEVREAVKDWIIYKRKRGQSYKDSSHVERLLKQFTRAGPQAFVRDVNKAIANNYQGLKVPDDTARTRQGAGQRHDPTASSDPRCGAF
jgi:hypothetical protein